MNNKEIQKNATGFAKKNKKRIAKELTDITIFPSDNTPVSIFMAGSPGAGKTEFSKNLIEILEENSKHRIVRIDGDEIRSTFTNYTGDNSYLFQGAISIIVEKIHDLVILKKQNFLLDGTFSKYDKAVNNIQRSLNKKRPVLIFYVYQDPMIAWGFTKIREEAEGRNIPKKAFIDQFLGAKNTVNKIQQEFGNKVIIFLVKKNYKKNTVDVVVELTTNETVIDDYIKDGYTENDLKEQL